MELADHIPEIILVSLNSLTDVAVPFFTGFLTLLANMNLWINDGSNTKKTREEEVLRQSGVPVSRLFLQHPKKIRER